ncbi:P-loop NTPase fold protein [Francisella tularensis]|uniref:P-loop NTPase fold protein n=1 Tax=Francisella tularensis TaxID=263 RepID=UPI0008F45EBA|nr:P-loop NTPase fold protein [Francisella tularensis]APA82878.1 hypothetical protein N894_0894 [Francisella tularensis subsp. novicida PA10-7858]
MNKLKLDFDNKQTQQIKSINWCKKISLFLKRFHKELYGFFIALTLISLFFINVISVVSGLIALVVASLFLKDSINTFICKKISSDTQIKTGVKIILGDWGSGKTHFFNKVYVKDYEENFEIVRLSCFSYSRSEFIKQIVAISFWNRWLSLNGLLAGYISFNWHNMLPKNKLIFIDDLERLPCDENMANDFIGIIEKLKKYNHIVIACSHSDVRQKVISNYLEKLVDSLPIEITLEKQIKKDAITDTVRSVVGNRLDNALNTHDKQKAFANLFTCNNSDAVNLRNIKKVLKSICEQDNTEDILQIIVDVINEPSKDISFDNIKKYHRYLKIKDKFELYLLSYELLFAYPNFTKIVRDFENDNKANKNSSEQPNSETEITKFREYLSKKIKDKHIEKAVKLADIYGGARYLKKISFASIGELLKDIDRLSNTSDEEVLKDLFLNSSDTEKYFTFGVYTDKKYLNISVDKRAYNLCKDEALYVIARETVEKNSVKIGNSPLNQYGFEPELYDMLGCCYYISKIQELWLCIAKHFIENNNLGVNNFTNKLSSFVKWDNHSKMSFDDDAYYNILWLVVRFLSLVEFVMNKYPDQINVGELLKNKSLDIWKEKFDSSINSRAKYKFSSVEGGDIDSRYFKFENSEHYLFELNACLDDETLQRIENISIMQNKFSEDDKTLPTGARRAVNTRISDKEFIEIKKDLESIFPKKLSLLNISENK